MGTYELIRPAGGGDLRYLLRRPREVAGPQPVLVFLHGYDEGPPTPFEEGLTRHGPLRPGNPGRMLDDFIVVAPQLPTRGDLWREYQTNLAAIVDTVLREHGGDPLRLYLTGFSYGGNGVFDLALLEPERWAALWSVDPTRVPARDPQRPVWLSIGEVARHRGAAFIRKLGLEAPAAEGAPTRVYLDEASDHVGSATLAYRDARIYAWLLSQTR